MNIINAIRRNWVMILVISVVTTIFTSRWLDRMIQSSWLAQHHLSWWNLLWILFPCALAVFAALNPWYILRPVRWFHWPVQKAYLVKQIAATKNPVAYLALLWLECHGQHAFIIGGLKGVQNGMFNGDNSIGTVANEMATAVTEQRKCDCQDHHCEIADECTCGRGEPHIKADCFTLAEAAHAAEVTEEPYNGPYRFPPAAQPS